MIVDRCLWLYFLTCFSLHNSIALASLEAAQQSTVDSFGIGALKMFAALALVVLLAYLILQKGVGGFLNRQRTGQRVQILERVILAGRHGIFLVQIDKRQVVLSTSDKGIELLLELTHQDEQAPPSTGFAILRNNTQSR